MWSVGVCFKWGFVDPASQAESIHTIFGMPSWVFYGVLLPLLFDDAVTIWFCFFFMVDDDLGEADDEVTQHLSDSEVNDV